MCSTAGWQPPGHERETTAGWQPPDLFTPRFPAISVTDIQTIGLGWFDASPPDFVVVQVLGRGVRGQELSPILWYLLLCSHGQIEKTLLSNTSGSGYLQAGGFLRSGSPAYLVFSTKAVREVRPGATLMSTDLLLLDEGGVRNLTKGIPLDDRSRLHWVNVEPHGLLLEAIWSATQTLQIPGGLTYGPTSTTWWFLEPNAPEARFEPAPEFVTADGRRVHLGQVVAWRNSGQAVVRLPDGFYLFSRESEMRPAP